MSFSDTEENYKLDGDASCKFEDIAGDGLCDDEANIFSCNFDDGDCCGDFDITISNCIQCKCFGKYTHIVLEIFE